MHICSKCGGPANETHVCGVRATPPATPAPDPHEVAAAKWDETAERYIGLCGRRAIEGLPVSLQEEAICKALECEAQAATCRARAIAARKVTP